MELLPILTDPPDRAALVGGGRVLSYPRLASAASNLADRLRGLERVAVWAVPSIETCVAVVGGLISGVAVVPVNPRLGERELGHVIGDSSPAAAVAGQDVPLPEPLAALPRVAVDLEAEARPIPPQPDGSSVAFVFYTSGTTGPPKGVLVPRRAVASNLDALAEVWSWGPDDVLTHALPLFHVHGLVLGVVGPLRRGGTLRHAGRFSPAAIRTELEAGASMLFGVPTMYHELADAAETDRALAGALGGARLLVSGSAALPLRDHGRIEELAGARVVERYGLTETLMNCATRADGDRRPGWVGPPLPGVEVRLLAEDGTEVPPDEATIGDVLVRGPNLFLGYLHRPDATEAAMAHGWFRTGDLAVRAEDGSVRIVGRRATDLIKTGGYKVGAGEVEAALLEHPAVAEAAVTGDADERLGERIVAWVVLRPGTSVDEEQLVDHVARLLAPHKRPREVRFLPALPRNDMGKVTKGTLRASG